MSKAWIIVGVVFIVVGLMWPLIAKLGLGHLPGDIIIRRKNTTIYFPLMTSIVISIVFSVILWLLRK